MNTIWFWPMAALVLLHALVWVALYVERIGEIKRRRLNPQLFAMRSQKAAVLEKTQAADNYNNLFEAPTLFHVLMLAALALQLPADALLLALAWIFVALRVAHSAIQITYNRVMHRFMAFAVSSMVLWFAWARAVWLVAQHNGV